MWRNQGGKIWPDLREGKNATSHWCHGTIGIGLTRLYLLKHGYQNEQVWKDFLYCLEDALSTKCKETGLCHGEMGRFLFLKEMFLVDTYSSVTRKANSCLEYL